MDSKEVFRAIIKEDKSAIKDSFFLAAESKIKDLMYFTEEEDPDKYDVQGTETDPALDPALDREFFLKTFDEGEHSVTLKTIGVGRNKPVSVYINDVRWEMFPGPIRAEEETKKFIKSKNFENWKGSKIAQEEQEEPTSEDQEEINKQEAESPAATTTKKEEEPS